jgi:hypothetical protein
MPSGQEIAAGIRGAVMLAQRDPQGMAQFNLTIEGFFNSFVAALLAAPAYAILVAQRYVVEAPSSVGYTIFAETVAYVLIWLVFPTAAIFLTRFFGLGHRYVPLVVASNWATFLQTLVLLAASLLGSMFGSSGGGALVLLAAMIAVLVYDWYIVRTALETTAGIASGFVAADLVLSFIVSGVVNATLGI